MALLFDADTEYVNYGSGSTLDSANLGPAFTVILWIYPTTIDANYRSIIEKYDSGESAGWTLISVDTDHAYFARVTTGGVQYVHTSNNTLSLNSWQCIAVRAMTIGSAPNVYIGDLSSPLSLQSTSDASGGSGSVANDGAYDLILAQNQVDTVSFRGRIAFVGIWDEDMSLGRMLVQQYHPHVTSTCVLFSFPGLHGASTCPDFSGNSNSGTVTNATLCPHVPLGPPFGFDEVVPYAVSAEVGDLSKSLTESMVIAEAITMSLPLPGISISESMVVSESIEGNLPLATVLSESITILESFDESLPLSQMVQQSMTIGELVTILKDLDFSIDEQMVVVDTINATIPAIDSVSGSATDTMTIAEVITANIPLSLSYQEQMTITEAITGLLDILSTVTETMTIGENIIAVLSSLGIAKAQRGLLLGIYR